MASKLKNPALESIIANIEKQLKGKDIIQSGDEDDDEVAGVISFGIQDVDDASNCGGVARGKIVEIFGPESGGKSYLTLKLIASAQKMGLTCCLVDAEFSYDKKWATKHGVDIKALKIIKCYEDEDGVKMPMSAERILDFTAAMCASGGFGLVVVDSTAALLPKKEAEGSIEDQDYALLARAMSKALRKIVGGCGSSKTTCVFVNQIREKMNVMFGNPETTPGGRALKFYAHQRIAVMPGHVVRVQDGKKDKPVARESKVKFVKNKVAAPFGEATIEIVFDEASMNPVVALCNVAKDNKLIGLRDGMFQIKKEVIGEKKNLDTGTSSSVQLADYLVTNSLVQKLIDAYLAAVKEEGGKVNKSVQELIDNPALIVSPLAGKSVSIEETKLDKALVATLENPSEDNAEEFKE